MDCEITYQLEMGVKTSPYGIVLKKHEKKSKKEQYLLNVTSIYRCSTSITNHYLILCVINN